MLFSVSVGCEVSIGFGYGFGEEHRVGKVSQKNMFLAHEQKTMLFNLYE